MEQLGLIDCIYPCEKSLNDVNHYRYVRLKNGVKALLISLPKDLNTHAGEFYAGADGPEFLRTGATSRAKNLASEVFFSPSKGKRSQSSDENEMEDDSMENSEDEEEEKSENKKKEESEDNSVELDSEVCPELVEILDDELLGQVQDDIVMSEEVQPLDMEDNGSALAALTDQMILINLKQIQDKEDRGFQHVFHNHQVPVIINVIFGINYNKIKQLF